MISKIKPPYLGAAYYPEAWDASQIDYDIDMMKKAGLNVARIGEFAWRAMEPSDGEFCFGWLHDVISRLSSSGIAVIIGTPTATPPSWLIKKYPDIAVLKETGQRIQHGGRRHCCSNNAHYIEYSKRIVEKMAIEFGDDKNIIGWQIDNEINMKGTGCFCPDCLREFSIFLENKYKTIQSLNESWNLNLFSQAYDSFEHVPAPSLGWHNPHLKLDWALFQNQSHIKFIHMQYDILKKYIRVPVGTDMMQLNLLDYERMTDHLDIVQSNHYDTREGLWTYMFWCDFFRTLKARPFWNTETSTCWNGTTLIKQNFKPEGFCKANSWIPIALGGEATLFWLWRTHWAGQELMHGSVLTPAGRPMHIFGEVQEVSNGFLKASDLVNNTKVHSRVALHFTSLNWNLFELHQQIDNFDYLDTLQKVFYKPIVESGIRPDVIGANKSLDGYGVLISPLMLTLEDGSLPQRIEEWVKDGGTWIVGPMSDVRNAIGAHYKDRAMGIVERLAGIKYCYFSPDSEGYIKSTWNDGSEFKGNRWYEFYECEEADTLVSYTTGHSAYTGKALAAKVKYGRGTIIVLGSLPSSEDMKKIISIACEGQNVEQYKTEGCLCVAPRSDNNEAGLIIIEVAGNPASIELPETMIDILTGRHCEGLLEVSPYEVFCLVKR